MKAILFYRIYGDGTREAEGPFVRFEALQYLYWQDDMRAMEAAEVGDQFVDADGDTWVRTQ